MKGIVAIGLFVSLAVTSASWACPQETAATTTSSTALIEASSASAPRVTFAERRLHHPTFVLLESPDGGDLAILLTNELADEVMDRHRDVSF